MNGGTTISAHLALVKRPAVIQRVYLIFALKARSVLLRRHIEYGGHGFSLFLSLDVSDHSYYDNKKRGYDAGIKAENSSLKP
jgi:hypothetical protein